MQISVYLSEELIERVDELAERLDRSRSRTIAELLEIGLRQEERGGDGLARLAGKWKDDRPADAVVREVLEGREYNQGSEEASR